MSPRPADILLPVALTAALVTAGCKKDHSHPHAERGAMVAAADMAAPAPPPPAPAPAFFAYNRVATGQHLAYSHRLGLRVPVAVLDRHYEAAQSKCLDDVALKCVLLNAWISRDETSGQASNASLEVRLPHDAVGPFVQALTSVLPGERPGAVIVVNQATNAVDLSHPLADSQREIAQLTDYRNRLESLENRASARTEDLIKLAHELSEVQSQLDSSQTRQRDLTERVDTETLSVTYTANAPDAGPSSPLQEAWRNAGGTLMENIAAALVFAISALPWVPLVLIGVWLSRLAFRRFGWKLPFRPKKSSNS